MDQDTTNCSICDNEPSLILKGGKDYFMNEGKSDDFDIHYCNSCRIGHTFPMMTNEELSSFYPESFEAFTFRKGLTGFLQQKKYKSDLKIIERYLSRVNEKTLYELGAGRGEFLAAAREAGFTVKGIEPGETGVKLAREYFNIELEQGFADHLNFNQAYDVVAARHVLEHVGDFHSCLLSVYQEGLKDEGVLFLKLPRLDSLEARLFKNFWHGYDLPRHRVHFTKEGIRLLLEKIGFKEVKVFNEAVPTTFIRSVKYYAKHGKSGPKKMLAFAFCALPKLFQFGFSQMFSIVTCSAGAGRMIIVAKKKL